MTGRTTLTALGTLAILWAGAPGTPAGAGSPNPGPPFVKGELLRTTHDGVTNDLLTGGLGKSGLALPAPPATADLRTRAIHGNYRALVDTAPGGGYGVFFGPNVTADGIPTTREGMVAGVEVLAFAGDASGKQNVTMMVQVPATFDPAKPCIVAAPSSGSRGVYGAIGTAGEWGLKRGCAVAYTDKGTGTGAHDLEDDTVNLITGERADAAAAGKASNFTARLNDEQRDRFNAATPHRFAFKHAHSEQNPEQDWGTHVLQSIELAFFVLNDEYPGSAITPENTTVIASSVSNGGGASIRAAEQDRKGLIDGVAVSEPNVNPTFDGRFAIVQGTGAPVREHSRSLYDYTTLVDVYQGCANLTVPFGLDLLNLTPPALGENRCASLREKGLLSTDTLADQGAEAQAIMNAFGILPEQNLVQPSHWFLFVPQAVAVTYARAYGRAGVAESLCGYSFGATDPAGNPAPLAPGSEAILFGTSNGIPPTGGVNLINNRAVGGPKEDRASVSASTDRADQNLDGALCLRALATGRDPVTGKALTGAMRALQARIARGIAEVRATGNLRGVPTVIVTGRNDAILPPNHTSRAYFGLSRLVGGGASDLRYYEVTNAQHLDVLNGFPGFNSRFVPLHHYFNRAMDLMFDHLTTGTPLPPSQVIRTVPRGGPPVPALGAANLPPIAETPAADALITFDGGTVHIPE